MQGDVFCQRNGVIEAQCQIGVALLEAVNLLFPVSPPPLASRISADSMMGVSMGVKP